MVLLVSPLKRRTLPALRVVRRPRRGFELLGELRHSLRVGLELLHEPPHQVLALHVFLEAFSLRRRFHRQPPSCGT